MRDEIIEMAKEAGFNVGMAPQIERFYNLAVQHEREECAKVCEENAKDFEQYADGCDDGRYDWKADGAIHCAEQIRARGEKQ